MRPMTVDDAALVANWRYEGEASVYNLDSDQPLLAELACYFAVWDGDRLIGFCGTGIAARVPGISAEPGTLDIGMGMDPALVGRGHGASFGQAVLDYLSMRHPGQTLRAVIKDWNARSLRLAQGLGFADIGELIALQSGQPVAYRLLILR